VVDEAVERRGDLIVELISDVRREKAEKRMSLNTPIKKLTVYAGDQSAAEAISQGESDIKGALKVENLVVLPEEGGGREVIQFATVHFIAVYEPAAPAPK
jgi:valyl-tRNA synthetase